MLNRTAVQFIRAQAGYQAKRVNPDFYEIYLQLIKEAAKLANTSIQHIEMFLFSISIKKITKVIENQ